uniref:M20_dimer domain-containing protein n=1 Tax=Globodera pallida TaxID=36090 RepID=A0A183BVH7_GLOPA
MSYDSIAVQIDKCKSKWIERLAEAVAIPSVSPSVEYRQEVFRMVDWTEKKILLRWKLCPMGNDKKKRTLLVYGHLDVQPAMLEDGWNTEPFELIEKEGKLFGRGSTDDKGPVLGMEESGSEGLDECVEKYKSFLSDVDFVCISDNYWLGKQKPCITYGLRGLSPFTLEITAPNQDLHSGLYGGTIHEPMNDLCWLLSQLSDTKGTILVKGIDKMVAKLTEEERSLYAKIDFDLEGLKKDIGVEKLTSDDPKEILMRRWRQPALSIHGIEGAFSGKGLKTVIPSKVIGKFSVRLVPHMIPDEVDKAVVAHVTEVWKSRASPNKMIILPMGGSSLPWLGDFKHPHFQAGVKAIKKGKKARKRYG